MRNKKNFSLSLATVLLAPLFVFSVAYAMEGSEKKRVTQDSLRVDRCASAVPSGTETESVTDRAEKCENMEKMRENRINAVKHLMAAQIRRAEKAIARMDQIIERIESRRDKIQGDGGTNVAAIDALLVKAQQDKADAEAALAEAKADMAALANSADPKVTAKEFKASMATLKKELRDLQKDLKDVLKEMRRLAPKGGEGDDDDGSTTTPPPPTPTPTPPSSSN